MGKLRKVFLCTALSACILAGCGNSKQQKEVKETKPQTKEEAAEVLDAEELVKIRKEALEAFEKISFDNIDVKCSELAFPKMDKLAVYGFNTVTLNDLGTPDEVLDKCMTEFIPKLIGEYDTDYLYDGNDIVGLEPENYYKVNYDNALSHTENYTSLPDVVYRDPEMRKKLELYTDCGIMNYSAGKIGNIIGINLLFGVQDVAEFVKSYDIDNDDLSDTYKLLDKEITIKEAVEKAENYWDSLYPLTTVNDIKPKVFEVNVYRIKESGEYVFNLLRTDTYNGIEIQRAYNGEITNGYEKSELYGDETGVMSEGFMVESDKIDIFHGVYNNYTEPVELKVYGRMVSFEEAINIVSDKLTTLPGEKFELNYAGINYKEFFGGDERDYDYYIVPTWEFHFRNPINEDEVKVFVDIETGEVRARINGC